MALQKQTIDLSLASRGDQKTDAKTLSPGTPNSVKNAQFTKRNRIDKRNGYDALNVTSIAGTLKEVTATENHLLVRDENTVYAYSDEDDDFQARGRYDPVNVSINSIDESRFYIYADCVHISGITYYQALSFDSDNSGNKFATMYSTVIDESTNEILRRVSSTDAVNNANITGGGCKLLEFSGAPYYFYNHGFSKTINVKKASTTPPYTLGNPVQVSNDIESIGTTIGRSITWDIMDYLSTRIVLAYPDDTTPTDLHLKYLNATPVVIGDAPYIASTIAMGVTPTQVTLSMSSGGSKFFIFIGSGNDITLSRYIIVNSDNTIHAASTNPGLAPGANMEDDTSGGFVMHPHQHNGKDGVLVFASCLSADAVLFGAQGYGTAWAHIAEDGAVTSFQPIAGIRVISRPHLYDGAYRYVFYRDEPNDSSYYYGSFEGEGTTKRPNISAQIYFGRAPDRDSFFAPIQANFNVTQITTDSFRIPLLTRDSFSSKVGISSALSAFNSTGMLKSVPYGKSMLIAGSQPHSFDGQYLRELGFFHRPIIYRMINGGGSGSVTALGTYSVVGVFEYTDRNGFLHRSAPSDAITFTLTAGTSLGVNGSNYNFTNIDSSGTFGICRIVLYRTEEGPGEIFYRDAHEDTTADSIASPNKALSSIGGNIFQQTLVISDAVLTTQEILYTDSGELTPSPIPPCKYVSSWGGRLWLGGSATDESIFFSKLNQTNIFPEFTQALEISTQSLSGETTGIAGYTDKLILSKRGRLFYTYGQGPDNLGGGGSFAIFEEIPGVGGAIDGKSMHVNSSGLHFQSDKGVFVLDGGLNTVHFGSAYEDETNGNDILKTLSPVDSETMRYVMSSGVLSYNTFFNTWSLDTSTELVPIDAAIYNNAFCVLTATKLLRENRTTWQDDSTDYDIEIQTGWITFSKLAGFQRLYRLFVVMDNHSAYNGKVSLAYDYGDYVDEVSFTESADPRIELYPTIQKCQAFRIKFEASTASGTGQGIDLNFISISVGVKRGLPKVASGQKSGVTTI